MQRKGRKVTVVSTLSTQPPMIADELRRQADYFVDLTSLREADRPRSGEPAARQAAPRAEDAEPLFDDELEEEL